MTATQKFPPQDFSLWYDPNEELGADFYCTKTLDFSVATPENPVLLGRINIKRVNWWRFFLCMKGSNDVNKREIHFYQ